MDRTHGPALGLFLLGMMMFVFGTLDLLAGEVADVPFDALSAIGLWMGALALRHPADAPAGPLLMIGLTVWAVAQVAKFVTLLFTPNIVLVPFGLLALGSAVAAAAAWRWYGALEDEEVARMMPLRVGLRLFGLGLFVLLALQVSSNGFGVPSVLLLMGAIGAALFVVSFAASADAAGATAADAA